jgi:hypothetical protein
MKVLISIPTELNSMNSQILYLSSSESQMISKEQKRKARI